MLRTVVLEKTLEGPMDCKETKPVHPKGNQSWIFIGRTDAEAGAPILWPPDVKSRLIGKDPDAGKDWRQEEKGTAEDKMVGESNTTERLNWLKSCILFYGVHLSSLPQSLLRVLTADSCYPWQLCFKKSPNTVPRGYTGVGSWESWSQERSLIQVKLIALELFPSFVVAWENGPGSCAGWRDF